MTADDHSLARLMALAQTGDAAAYATLLRQCQVWLKRYFARRIAPGAIDDLVQETLVSVHRKRASFDPERPFLPWLAAIARYRWVDQLRRNYKADEVEMPNDLAADSEEDGIAARISLEALFRHLPERQALAIRLVKIEGLSVAEAAARSGQSEPLIKVNIHRGLKRLAALVESE